jgi:signal transduction histidine kinase
MQQGFGTESPGGSFAQPRPHAFALLILAGVFLEFVVHYWFGISTVYTHFYYLIIVIAGLWYGRKAILIALLFAALHITVSYIITGTIVPDAILRSSMFMLVALVVGAIAEQMNSYRDQLAGRNRELQETNSRLESSQSAYQVANKKLNLLSGITRHDIKNQILALMGFIALAKMKTSDPDLLHYIEQEETAAQNIQRQIEFTKNYEEIGVHAPQWQDIGMHCAAMQALVAKDGIRVSAAVKGLEIFADPLLEKVFENLIDNSRRHGERVRQISFSTLQYGLDYIALVYEDDGVGIHEEDKGRIFEKGFGKNTGLGLFLIREILSITGLTIKETGEYGRGARIEIMVPKGKYRFSAPQEKKELLGRTPPF